MSWKTEHVMNEDPDNIVRIFTSDGPFVGRTAKEKLNKKAF